MSRAPLTILIDFDHVLFDSDRFQDQLPVNAEVFKDTYEQVYHDGGYDHREHAALLDVSPEQVQDVYRAAEDCLYDPDVLEALGETHTVYIATRKSHDGWQQQKIRSAGVHGYVDGVIVFSGDPDASPKYFPDADVLVDDTLTELSASSVQHGYHFDEDENTLTQVAGYIADIAE